MVKLSVVVASVSGLEYLERCLSAMQMQEGDVDAEVIVADGIGPEVAESVKQAYPNVTMLALDKGKSIQDLRSIGIAASSGEIIAITEDHCIPAPNWFASIARAHALHREYAIGGVVENGAKNRLVDWAVFFCEYSNFVPPMKLGIARDLPGPNVSYKGTARTIMKPLIQTGYWETFVHQRLRSMGYELLVDPSLVVTHREHFTLRGFVRERYNYSRAFAAQRVRSEGGWRARCYVALAPVLPPVLLVRIARRVVSRKYHRLRFCACLPYLALFTLAWAAGEMVGSAVLD
jgi:glycosyltransferase involved in cell wall biosynthesis